MNTVEVPVAPHEGHTLLSWQRVQPAVYAGSYLRVLDCALGRVARLKADGQLVERELGLAAAAFLASGVAQRVNGDVPRDAAQEGPEAARQ